MVLENSGIAYDPEIHVIFKVQKYSNNTTNITNYWCCIVPPYHQIIKVNTKPPKGYFPVVTTKYYPVT